MTSVVWLLIFRAEVGGVGELLGGLGRRGDAGAAGIGIGYVQNLHRSNVFVIKSVYVLEYCSIFVVSTL